MDQQQFQADVMRVLGKLEGHAEATVQRLDTLNGKVAKQEARLQTLEQFKNSQTEIKKEQDKWKTRLMPFIYGGCGFLILLALQNATTVLKAIKP